MSVTVCPGCTDSELLIGARFDPIGSTRKRTEFAGPMMYAGIDEFLSRVAGDGAETLAPSTVADDVDGHVQEGLVLDTNARLGLRPIVVSPRGRGVVARGNGCKHCDDGC